MVKDVVALVLRLEVVLSWPLAIGPSGDERPGAWWAHPPAKLQFMVWAPRSTWPPWSFHASGLPRVLGSGGYWVQFLLISLHFSAFLCISLYFSAFLAFLCNSLNSSTFLYSYLHLHSAAWILSSVTGSRQSLKALSAHVLSQLSPKALQCHVNSRKTQGWWQP